MVSSESAHHWGAEQCLTGWSASCGGMCSAALKVLGLCNWIDETEGLDFNYKYINWKLAAYLMYLSSGWAVHLPCRQTAGGAVADLEERLLKVCRGEKRPSPLKSPNDGSWQHKGESSDSLFRVKMLQKLLTLHISAHSIRNHLHCDPCLARLLGTPRLLFKLKLTVFGPSDSKRKHIIIHFGQHAFFRWHKMHKEILIVLTLTFELRCCSAPYRQFSVLLHIARASGLNALCPWRIRNPQLTIRQL